MLCAAEKKDRGSVFCAAEGGSVLCAAERESMLCAAKRVSVLCAADIKDRGAGCVQEK